LKQNDAQDRIQQSIWISCYGNDGNIMKNKQRISSKNVFSLISKKNNPQHVVKTGIRILARKKHQVSPKWKLKSDKISLASIVFSFHEKDDHIFLYSSP
jgi:hypothetical protein